MSQLLSQGSSGRRPSDRVLTAFQPMVPRNHPGNSWTRPAALGPFPPVLHNVPYHSSTQFNSLDSSDISNGFGWSGGLKSVMASTTERKTEDIKTHQIGLLSRQGYYAESQPSVHKTLAVAEDGKIVLGRASSSKGSKETATDGLEKWIHCPVMSKAHAVLRVGNGIVYVADLGSLHGTQVNNQQLVPNVERPLKDGDVLILGKTVVKGGVKTSALVLDVTIRSTSSRRQTAPLTPPSPADRRVSRTLPSGSESSPSTPASSQVPAPSFASTSRPSESYPKIQPALKQQCAEEKAIEEDVQEEQEDEMHSPEKGRYGLSEAAARGEVLPTVECTADDEVRDNKPTSGIESGKQDARTAFSLPLSKPAADVFSAPEPSVDPALAEVQKEPLSVFKDLPRTDRDFRSPLPGTGTSLQNTDALLFHQAMPAVQPESLPTAAALSVKLHRANLNEHDTLFAAAAEKDKSGLKVDQRYRWFDSILDNDLRGIEFDNTSCGLEPDSDDFAWGDGVDVALDELVSAAEAELSGEDEDGWGNEARDASAVAYAPEIIWRQPAAAVRHEALRLLKEKRSFRAASGSQKTSSKESSGATSPAAADSAAEERSTTSSTEPSQAKVMIPSSQDDITQKQPHPHRAVSHDSAILRVPMTQNEVVLPSNLAYGSGPLGNDDAVSDGDSRCSVSSDPDDEMDDAMSSDAHEDTAAASDDSSTGSFSDGSGGMGQGMEEREDDEDESSDEEASSDADDGESSDGDDNGGGASKPASRSISHAPAVNPFTPLPRPPEVKSKPIKTEPAADFSFTSDADSVEVKPVLKHCAVMSDPATVADEPSGNGSALAECGHPRGVKRARDEGDADELDSTSTPASTKTASVQASPPTQISTSTSTSGDALDVEAVIPTTALAAVSRAGSSSSAADLANVANFVDTQESVAPAAPEALIVPQAAAEPPLAAEVDVAPQLDVTSRPSKRARLGTFLLGALAGSALSIGALESFGAGELA